MSFSTRPRSSALLRVNRLFFSLVFSFLVLSFCGELRVFILKFSGRLGSLMMRPLCACSAAVRRARQPKSLLCCKLCSARRRGGADSESRRAVSVF